MRRLAGPNQKMEGRAHNTGRRLPPRGIPGRPRLLQHKLQLADTSARKRKPKAKEQALRRMRGRRGDSRQNIRGRLQNAAHVRAQNARDVFRRGLHDFVLCDRKNHRKAHRRILQKNFLGAAWHGADNVQPAAKRIFKRRLRGNGIAGEHSRRNAFGFCRKARHNSRRDSRRDGLVFHGGNLGPRGTFYDSKRRAKTFVRAQLGRLWPKQIF